MSRGNRFSAWLRGLQHRRYRGTSGTTLVDTGRAARGGRQIPTRDADAGGGAPRVCLTPRLPGDTQAAEGFVPIGAAPPAAQVKQGDHRPDRHRPPQLAAVR
jgi:hypothetical protein